MQNIFIALNWSYSNIQKDFPDDISSYREALRSSHVPTFCVFVILKGKKVHIKTNLDGVKFKWNLNSIYLNKSWNADRAQSSDGTVECQAGRHL